MSTQTAANTIRRAESVLKTVSGPGTREARRIAAYPKLSRRPDARWQAIIDVGRFIESHPDEVWSFAAKWGTHPNEDLRAAIACVLVAHLLEHHFDRIFPRAAKLAGRSFGFASALATCWKFGDAAKPQNARKLNRIRRRSSG